MKKLILCTSLILISLTLSSCKITQEGLWGADFYKENFKEFAISDDGKGLILVGKKYHYLLEDKDGVLKRIIESSVISKIQILDNGIFFVDASSKKAKFDFRIVSMDADLLSDEEKKVFKKLNFSEPSNRHGDYNYLRFYESLRLEGSRYLPTPKNTYKTHQLNLAEPFEYDINEEPTPLKTTGKVLLTPFAVAADIVLSPVYFVTMMWVAIAARHDGHINDTKK